MSPGNTTKKSKNALTIEFAGIATLVWDKRAGTAEVHLVDLASAGYERHYAALSIEVTEATPRTIKGPSADTSVSLAGRDADVGVWNLLGTTVEVVGAAGKLTVNDSKAEVVKKPTKEAQSVRWLANVGSLCESDRLNPLCPLASIIKIPAGHVTASGAASARKVGFTDHGTPIGPDRFCLPRFTATIPFDDEIAIRISRERVLRFGDSMNVVISNTCVCGLGVGPVANHFYGHYDVVEAKRRPVVRRAGPLPKTPMIPEFCWVSYVELAP